MRSENNRATSVGVPRCLIIDTDATRASVLARQICREGEFEGVTDLNFEGAVHAILCVEPASPNVVREVAQKYSQSCSPIVLVALNGDVSRHASPYLSGGANDILWLPMRIDELILRLRTWLEKSRAEQETLRLRSIVREQQGDSVLLGESEAMQRIKRLVERVAQNESAVLISGETGTGKEVTARAIHEASPRREAPFVALNLSAIPENLVESELFGHVSGAFTGANSHRMGQLEAANGGTLFLDEIGDLPLSVQVKLLRVLQERSIQRVGENKSRKVDFRLLSATHQDLDACIDQGKFREDLYYRVNVVELELPPLRERGDDIENLAKHFLDETARAAQVRVSLGSNVSSALRGHNWPGNVRELKHTMERAVALSSDGDVIGADLIQFRRRRGPAASLTTRVIERGEGLDNVLRELEQEIIQNTLTRCNGSQAEAARILKIPRQTLQGRLRKFARANQE